MIRRTSPKKLHRALADLTEWCKKSRCLPLKRFFSTLNAKFRGHYNYYGVIGNYVSLLRFYRAATRIVFKWHNRRSQRRSKTWPGFREMIKHFSVPTPRIAERLLESNAAWPA